MAYNGCNKRLIGHGVDQGLIGHRGGRCMTWEPALDLVLVGEEEKLGTVRMCRAGGKAEPGYEMA